MASRPPPYDPVHEAARENAESTASASDPRPTLISSVTPINLLNRADGPVAMSPNTNPINTTGTPLVASSNTTNGRRLRTLLPRPSGLNPSIPTNGVYFNGPLVPRPMGTTLHTFTNTGVNQAPAAAATRPAGTSFSNPADAVAGQAPAAAGPSPTTTTHINAATLSNLAPRPIRGNPFNRIPVLQLASAGGATTMDAALANIGSHLSQKLNPHERACALALHRYILSCDIDDNGVPIAHRTGVREFGPLHRAIRNSHINPYQATGVCSSTTGILHSGSGLVNREHNPTDTQIDSRFTAQDLCFSDAIFRWFVLPSAPDPFHRSSMRGRRIRRTTSIFLPRSTPSDRNDLLAAARAANSQVIDLTGDDSDDGVKEERDGEETGNEKADLDDADIVEDELKDEEDEEEESEEDDGSEYEDPAGPASKRRRVR